MVEYVNAHYLSKKDLALVKDLVQFILEKFFTKKRRSQLKIQISFKKNLLKKRHQLANCIWQDTHIRPKEFQIQVDINQKIGLILNSIAHEMTHVKQWTKGEFYQQMRRPEIYMFKKSRIDTSKTDYWDYPWEIEAHGRGIGLVCQWYAARDHDNEDLLEVK